MATTTATLTLSSSDLTDNALSLSSTATLTKITASTGLDQTTGVARRYYITAQTNSKLIDAADFTDARQHKVYIKNTSTSDTETVTVTLGSSNLVMGKLSGGDWTFFPWDGANDIDVNTSATAMAVEYMVIFEA